MLFQSFARSIEENDAKLLKQSHHLFGAVSIFYCCVYGKLSRHQSNDGFVSTVSPHSLQYSLQKTEVVRRFLRAGPKWRSKIKPLQSIILKRCTAQKNSLHRWIQLIFFYKVSVLGYAIYGKYLNSAQQWNQIFVWVLKFVYCIFLFW
jgi:hypothetical protein